MLADVLYVTLFAFSIIFGSLLYLASYRMDTGPANIGPLPPTVFEKKVKKMVRGFPMEKMASQISRQDKKVATYLVAIGKKESNWGKYSPRKNGRDCYNYWGYRGPQNPTASGYSCFDNPRQAVREVGGRIRELMDQDVDTPGEMAVWKCGSDCSWDNPQNVSKWIADVDYYYKKIYE